MCVMSTASKFPCSGALVVGRPSFCRCGCSRRLDEQSSALILAHELAHLRRRDHLVRVVELIVSTVYWWNPLVGLLRRQIHESEELCCDAWVRWAFPDCTKSYAKIVLKTAESLSTRAARRIPAAGQSVSAFPFTESEDRDDS